MAASELVQSVATASPSGGTPPVSARSSVNRWLLTGLLAFTLLIRGSVLWSMRGNLEQDPDAYREIADFLVQRGEFAIGKLSPLEGASRPVATAYRPPLYPILLSNFPAAEREGISLTKVAGLHLALGLVTVWLTWATARKVLGAQESSGIVSALHPKIAPLVAGLIVACDPILLNQQTLIMTETLAAFLAILSLWCLVRFDAARTPFNAAMAGGAIGLAVLCRPTFLPWLALVAVAVLLLRGGLTQGHVRNNVTKQKPQLLFPEIARRLVNVTALLAGAAAIISPWAIRNYREFGKPLITTTHGGYTLYLGNNDSFYTWLTQDRSGLPWDARGFDLSLWRPWSFRAPVEHKEFAIDEYCYRNAFQTIRRQPAVFAQASAYRLGQLWSPLPNQLTANESRGRRWLRYATGGWYCGVYALAAIGLWRLRWKFSQPPWLWGLLLCLAFSAVHTVYWTNLRMRAPLMPFVAIAAAAAFDTGARRKRA
jgi:hypothetical protein